MAELKYRDLKKSLLVPYLRAFSKRFPWSRSKQQNFKQKKEFFLKVKFIYKTR